MSPFPEPMPETTPREVPLAVTLGAHQGAWFIVPLPLLGVGAGLYYALKVAAWRDQKYGFLAAAGFGVLWLLTMVWWLLRVARARALYRDGKLVDGILKRTLQISGAVSQINVVVAIPDGEVHLIALNQLLVPPIKLVQHRGWAGVYLSEHQGAARVMPAIFRCAKIRRPS